MNKEQDNELNNWIGWLQAKIPVLKKSENVFWLKQALIGYAKCEFFKPESGDTILSAEEYLNITNRHLLFSQHFDQIIEFAESYVALAVEQERKRWESETMVAIAECLSEGHIHELDYNRLKSRILGIFTKK